VSHEFDQKARTWDDDPVRAARAAEVAHLIGARIPLRPEMHVLDFGGGTGLLGFHLLPQVASVTFADPSEGMLGEVERKLQAGGHANGRTLRIDPDAPELPRRYDAIVSLMTLHHVVDPPATIRLLAAHVEPGGWLALCDLDTEDGTFHDDPHADVHHGFDRDELASSVEGVGFGDVRVSTAHIMRRDRPGGVREYPLFLLTGQRRPHAPGDS
jgi:2-polyprenyl-3-methyl-5-hydroxy-6-metoxy-1,4-benzoquinol methylase